MAKIQFKNIQDCYFYGKIVVTGNINIGSAASKLEETGMDKGSAQIYIKTVQAMINGELYKRTISELATRYFLEAITEDYEKEGLRNALNSIKLHLEYQNNHQTLPSIRRLYNEYIEKLS